MWVRGGCQHGLGGVYFSEAWYIMGILYVLIVLLCGRSFLRGIRWRVAFLNT